MRKKLCRSLGWALAATVVLAAPAAAHPGHQGCARNAEVAIVPLARDGIAGDTASGLALGGTLPEDIAASHAALCEAP